MSRPRTSRRVHSNLALTQRPDAALSSPLRHCL